MEVDLYLMSENFRRHNSGLKNTIYAAENKYGYRINIMHPKIKPLYQRFRKWKGVPDWCPLSDAERLEFESFILKQKGSQSH